MGRDFFATGRAANGCGTRLRLVKERRHISHVLRRLRTSTRSRLSTDELRGAAGGHPPRVRGRDSLVEASLLWQSGAGHAGRRLPGLPCGGLPPLAVWGRSRWPKTASLCPRAGSSLLEATLLGSVPSSCYVELTSVRVDTSGLGEHWRRGRSDLEGTGAEVLLRRPPASPEDLGIIGGTLEATGWPAGCVTVWPPGCVTSWPSGWVTG